MLENCRALREKQKRFLKEQGLNPEEFLSLGTAADYYKFYHIKKRKRSCYKEVSMYKQLLLNSNGIMLERRNGTWVSLCKKFLRGMLIKRN